MTDIPKLRELLARASEAPWSWESDDDGAIDGANGGAVCYVAQHANIRTSLARGNESYSHRDAALIVEMRNQLPALLDELERARARADTAEEKLENAGVELALALAALAESERKEVGAK